MESQIKPRETKFHHKFKQHETVEVHGPDGWEPGMVMSLLNKGYMIVTQSGLTVETCLVRAPRSEMNKPEDKDPFTAFVPESEFPKRDHLGQMMGSPSKREAAKQQVTKKGWAMGEECEAFCAGEWRLAHIVSVSENDGAVVRLDEHPMSLVTYRTILVRERTPHKHKFEEADGRCDYCGIDYNTWYDQGANKLKEVLPKAPPPLEHPAPAQEGVGVKQHLGKGDCPPGTKDTEGKLRYNLIPAFSLAQVASVLTKGAVKYAPNNWQLVPDAENKYTEAIMRHTEAMRLGELRDPESGELHSAHIATNAMFKSWFERNK